MEGDDLFEVFASGLAHIVHHSFFFVAYSGGMDSHVLLHLLAQYRLQNPDIQLRAIHVNHGLSVHAVAWEQHCQLICDALNIPLLIKRVHVIARSGESLEAIARNMRYAAIKESLLKNEVLVVAHSEDDQGETVMLQLLRGAGVKGLSGMPVSKPWGCGFLLRPLLSMSRADLKQYARTHHLQWVEDDSNTDLQFRRNYLRHQVWPSLLERWPAVARSFTRTASHCAQTQLLLTRYVEEDLNRLETEDGRLALSPLLTLHSARQDVILRLWLEKQGCRMPSQQQLWQLKQDVMLCVPDASPLFVWEDVEIRRYQDYLYILPALPMHDNRVVLPWSLEKPLFLPAQLGTLWVETKRGSGIDASFNLSRVTVRFRCGGERCRPHRKKQSWPLKKWMQVWKIPPWQRDRVPLIFYNEALVMVVGYCICEGFAALGNQLGKTVKYSVV